MRGSLEQPPIVIRASRWKATLVAVVCTGFVLLGVMMLLGRPNEPWQALFVVAVFGLGLIIAAASFIWPARLEVSKAGIDLRVLFRRRRWSWAEIGNFRTIAIDRTRMVAFDLRPEAGRASVMGRLSRSMAVVDGGLPTGWPMPAEALADLLNEARARWLSSGATFPAKAPPSSRRPTPRDPPPIVQ